MQPCSCGLVRIFLVELASSLPTNITYFFVQIPTLLANIDQNASPRNLVFCQALLQRYHCVNCVLVTAHCSCMHVGSVSLSRVPISTCYLRRNLTTAVNAPKPTSWSASQGARQAARAASWCSRSDLAATYYRHQRIPWFHTVNSRKSAP
jgi:hypothetical protein